MKLAALILLFLLVTTNGLVAPSSMTPDHHVQAQLDALKDGEFARAFACYSDDSQVVIGDIEQFVELISKPPFETLIAHEESQVVMISQFMDPDVAICLVKVVFAKKWRKKFKHSPCLYFNWELSREDDESPWDVEAFFPDFDDMDFGEIEMIPVDEEEEGDMFGFGF